MVFSSSNISASRLVKTGPQPSICWESPQQFYAIFVQLVFVLNREKSEGEVRFILAPNTGRKKHEIQVCARLPMELHWNPYK